VPKLWQSLSHPLATLKELNNFPSVRIRAIRGQKSRKKKVPTNYTNYTNMEKTFAWAHILLSCPASLREPEPQVRIRGAGKVLIVVGKFSISGDNQAPSEQKL